MALIKCPECTKEVSDRSEKCVHCGYPIRQSFYTNIYIPKYRSDNFVEDFMCYFIRDKVNITNENGTRVYVHGGKTDMNYKLFIKEPTKIKILKSPCKHKRRIIRLKHRRVIHSLCFSKIIYR